ncbi:hypothetical protein [Nonomuraea basaltis]|uniref:hypothetical protein n=1 Tax=Nonomuraea basaltis TaxID=2495887 RepID=UPI00110C5D65|nr:hypothetical protein [Nonomuraea basaltis]TMR88044.1 hypothetical protein EJK15_68405 [Nonomuraea basaltis]
MLDGLDEIGEQARTETITALNASLTAGDQVILTSRTAEFTTAVATAGRPLTGAAVIIPTQLTPKGAADYLRVCLAAAPSDAWQKVLAALENHSVPGLAELTSTPLGLWLIRTVYADSGTNPTPLTGPLGEDISALRAHLLDQVIPALIKTRPPSTQPDDHYRPRHRLDANATRRYLTYLARAFPPAITRDIPWWRVAATLPHSRRTIRLAAGLATGLGRDRAGRRRSTRDQARGLATVLTARLTAMARYLEGPGGIRVQPVDVRPGNAH